MATETLNLYIVDDNKSMVLALKQYLQTKFGSSLSISTFNDGESCLEKVNYNTHLVILDHFLNGKNGLEILKRIKIQNPKTEVVMLSSHQDAELAVKTYQAGAKEYIIKDPGSWNKITALIHYIITQPVKIIIREFQVSKFIAIFLLTFIAMAIVTFVVLQQIT